ncbi:MotA/TolQ/ExbB proton channel family protein [Paucibacter sp. R3-3]|uniref:MotA/TolQ/ExbB proton channel family protein n=1 Tax=Roseateles agri TaxID=3098619 RepID=A0ABU5DN12_9BURK|nr:MotA/TolQ/ExbB proton channel family protein [Paucibacter sp. R3-3]MDY0747673.1 MotA/TolQ/ExbB proton channel family protein [Paucibacter sp. R3-3]
MSTVPNVAASLAPWELFLHADPIVKTIIVGLGLASLASWAVTADKLLQFRRLRRLAGHWLAAAGSRKSLEAFAQQAERDKDPIARVHDAVLGEWKTSHEQRLHQSESGRNGIKERLARIAQIASGVEVEHLQRGLLVLATIGSVAPFIGLFGTVWGIMNSFQGIAASNDTSLTVVAPGIAEALFATALGLIAAIPAVVSYNRASRGLGSYASQLATLIGLLEVHLSRALESGEHVSLAEQPSPVRAHRSAPVALAAQGA